MKTKDLIRQLQEADPSGELECCLGNADIHFIDVEPAYYDGCLQVLVRDEHRIVGAKYVSKGHKVVIHPLSIRDAIFDKEDCPVDLSDLQESWRERYKSRIEEYRQETRRISEDVEKGSFIQYALQRFALQYGEDFDSEEIKTAASEFFDANLTYKDPLPADLVKLQVPMIIDGAERMVWASWNDRRKRQWDREVALEFDGKKVLFTRMPRR